MLRQHNHVPTAFTGHSNDTGVDVKAFKKYLDYNHEVDATTSTSTTT
jgi:hypothetical protein